jgi:thiol-disulfide isomerase/thioredoxin
MKAVRITALWCMSCLVMRSRYDKIFKDYGIDQVTDLDFDEDDISTYDVGKVLPEVIIYKDNQEIIRLTGEKSKKELKRIFSSLNQ